MSISSRLRLLLAPRRSVREAFTRHFERRDWGEPETVSGRGSSLRSTAALRSALPALFAELGVRSVLDAGCGDFHWFRELAIELDSYLGVEVVPALAAENQRRHGGEGRNFVALDVIRDPLPRVDLVLCRDVLVHLKTRQALAALRNFRRSGSTWLLATTFDGAHANADVALGGWRPLDLERPPFALGPPLRRIGEADSVEDPRYADKALGLWRLGAPPAGKVRP
jgi:SAM-dependent methyltransferase